jgi:hypothetical protein
MDKDFFIFLKQDSTRTITEDSATAKVGLAATRVMVMPSKENLSCSLNELRHPRPRGRRVTIGGSDRRPNDDHSPPQADRRAPASVPLGASPIVSKHHTSEPSTQMTFICRQQIKPKTQQLRRPYPPTSWKSSSTLDSVTLDAGGSCISDATERIGICGQPADAAIESSLDTATAVVGSSQAETRLTLDKPARTPSRRQYTIVPSKLTGAASVTPFGPSKDKAPIVSDRIVTEKAALPDPETAYAQAFHYTTCPHISPPKSRPLNVQPALVQYHESLLLRPPPAGTAPPDIYILDGACFDCDISARRQTESGILETYTQRLSNLTIQLSLLQHDIAAEYSEPRPDEDSGAFTAFTLPSTLELSPDVTQGIQEIEEQLSQLIKKRDEDIKQVWGGFTARWGPGTVLIQRDKNDGTPSRAESCSTTRTSSSRNSSRVPSADVPAGKASTMTSTTSIGANTTDSPSRQSSFATRTRASSVQDRYSDGTYNVSVESSLDRVKGRGRMLVDWIRPGRSEGKSPGGNQTLSRKNSRQGRRVDNGA